MAPKLASEGGKGGVMKYFVPGHLLGSSRQEMEKCSVMRPGGSLGIHSNLCLHQVFGDLPECNQAIWDPHEVV